ncbi:MAG: hypothetical protein U0031_22305 [Thermomicrobiales bacterium]
MLRRFLGFWIVGCVVIVMFQTVGAAYLGRVPLGLIPQLSQIELTRFLTFQNNLLLFWTLIVMLMFMRQQVQGSSILSRKSRHIDYLLLWIVGAVAVVNWGPWLLDALSPIDFTRSGSALTSTATAVDSSSMANSPSPGPIADGALPPDLSMLIALLAAWTAVVIIILLFVGDGEKDGFYDVALAPYKAVLMTLTVVVLMTFLANVFAFFSIESRVRSLEAPVLLLNRSVSELAASADTLYQTASGLKVSVVNAAAGGAEGSSRDVTDANPGSPNERLVQPLDLGTRAANVVLLAHQTSERATDAVRQLDIALAIERAKLTERNQGGEAPEQELPAVDAVLRDAQSAAVQLAALATTIESERLPYLRRDTPSFIPAELSSELAEIANISEIISLRARAATEALDGLESRGATILLWLAAFYSAFVMFPWVLLLMFFYRKREFRAIEIISDLQRLDPSDGLLKRALGVEKSSTELSSSAVDGLLERAFSNREYVLSVSLLTVLTAAGWYYFLYPRADIGISDLVRSDAGITALTSDLAAHASPLTMGFAGAYFFVAQMLLRRYLAGDLYPSAFLQGAVRIIWVFTLSVALAVLLPGDEHWMKTGAIIAFVAGIFPREGLRVISHAASGMIAKCVSIVTPGEAFPADTEPVPLTNLDGINIWVESRLLEENVENVQGMATAPIEQLVVGTYYPASRIVDWVDQAILMTHCGDQREWCPPLRTVGIRTATDLLDAALPSSRPQSLDEANFAAADASLVELEHALSDATGSDLAGKPLTAAILAEMCRVIWPDPNLRYIQRYRLSTDQGHGPAGAETDNPIATESNGRITVIVAPASGGGSEPTGENSAADHPNVKRAAPTA